MQHPYLREGMAEERIARLAADARTDELRNGHRKVRAPAVVVERLLRRHPPEQAEVSACRLSEAA